ncbi:hypothetical protein BYT27DRAFT_7060738, partial [Phlegmacium glaucopus]
QPSSPTRKRSIFSSNSRDSTHDPTHDNSSTRSGLFRRHRSNSSEYESTGEGSSRFFGLRRNDNIENDPTIRRALKKVADAEKAEKQADIALIDARQRVRDAQEHVRILEQEALEGAKLAKAKQAQSKMVSRSAKALGRHG